MNCKVWSDQVITRKLLRYTKNITGTNAYWNDVKGKLKSTINQVVARTIFWELCCAESLTCLNFIFSFR